MSKSPGEADCGWLSTKSGIEVNQYEPLASAIEKWLEKPFSDLPKPLSDRVTSVFNVSWDSLTPGQRLSVAEQWDVQHNPAEVDLREYWFDFFNRRDELDGEDCSTGRNGNPNNE